MRRTPQRPQDRLTAAITAIVALIASVFGVSYVASPSYEATMLTAPTMGGDIGEDVDLTVNKGLKGTIHGFSSIAQTPLIDGWEQSDVRSGTVMPWCLQESRDEEAKQYMRAALNELAALFPNSVKWRETCDGSQRYTFGDTAATDCGSQAIACAVYMGSNRGRVSINPTYTNGRSQLKRIAIYHEQLHITLSVFHTGCGADPDSEISIMSPANLSTQQPCHTPPGTGLHEPDYRLAVQKYNLQGGGTQPTPTPRPTATPEPAVKRAVLRRWTLPEWNPGCQPQVQGWCIDSNAAVTSRGAWMQIVVIDRDGRESGPFGFTFVEP